MSVDTPHPTYHQNHPDWERCRHAVAGERAVKEAGEKYLPRMSGMDASDYESYKMRASFYAASDRTVTGCTGAILRKAIDVQADDTVKEWLKTVGIGTESFDMIVKQVLNEVLTTGRAGVLVDAADIDDPMPYIVCYYAENIINWRTTMRDGAQVLTLVVLRETHEVVNPDDDFEVEIKTRYRVLRLEDADGDSPTYTQTVWVEVEHEQPGGGSPVVRYEPEDTITPTLRGGKRLDFIPFVFSNPRTAAPDIEKSPILDLVDQNFSHYRTSADLEHGRHFVALPTAWAAGFEMRGDTLRVGSGAAWMAESPTARCGYLEFSGAGLGHLSGALEEKEKKMAALGGKLLEQKPTTPETLGAVQLRQSGEHSVLVSLAISVGEALTQAVRWGARWLGRTEDVAEKILVVLSQEYDSTPLDPVTMQALMAQVQGGLMSWETFFYNQQKGGLYPDGVTADDEKDAIAATGPALPGLTPPDGGGGGDNGGGPPGGGGDGTGDKTGATGGKAGDKGGGGLPAQKAAPAAA